MPRHIVRSTDRFPRHEKLHEKLVKDLAHELREPGTGLEPLILEERIDSTRSRHVNVIWDAWKALPDEERSAVIVEAYERAEGEEKAKDITLATGVTGGEALALGLLPWKVLPARKKTDRIATEDYDKALRVEARNTLLGEKAKELRYARQESAEEAVSRLTKALTGSHWTIAQEVPYEA